MLGNAINQRLSQHVIVLGLPRANGERIDTLRKRALHRFRDFLPGLEEADVTHPAVDVEHPKTHALVKRTVGIAFVDCGNPSTARDFAFRVDGAPLGREKADDKPQEALRVVLATQFERILAGQDRPAPFDVPPDASGAPQRLAWPLLDERMFDQLVFSANKLCHAVWFNSTTSQLEDIQLPQHFQAIDDFRFSPEGLWLGTRVANRLNFYGGERWAHCSTFLFPDLGTQMEKDSGWLFSFDGRFLLCRTESVPEAGDNEYAPRGAAVFDPIRGSCLRRIALDRGDYYGIGFAKGNDILRLRKRELALFPVTKDSYGEPVVLAADVDFFSPSPRHKLVFTLRRGTESRITFWSTEKRTQVHCARAYNATDAIPIWHPALALCAVVSKGKANNEDMLTIYDLRSVPPAMHTESFKRQFVRSCSWDPTESQLRIAIIAESQNGARQINYFEVGSSLVRIKVYPTTGLRLQFSPAGRFAIAEALEENLIVQFFDMDEGLLSPREMEGVTGIEWDPSGIFVLTSAGKAAASGLGFSIWLLDGTLVLRSPRPNFKKCMWRPRTSEVTQEELERVGPLVPEALAKFGRIGAGDPSAREDELREMKSLKTRKWLHREVMHPVNPRGSPYQFTVSLARPDELDDV